MSHLLLYFIPITWSISTHTPTMADYTLLGNRIDDGNNRDLPVGWLVGWLEINVPFQHKYGYIVICLSSFYDAMVCSTSRCARSIVSVN